MLPRDNRLAPTSSSSNNLSILPATCSNLCSAKPRRLQPAATTSTTTTTTSRTQGPLGLWAEKSHRTAFVVALVVPAVRALLVRRTTSSISTENITYILNVARTHGIGNAAGGKHPSQIKVSIFVCTTDVMMKPDLKKMFLFSGRTKNFVKKAAGFIVRWNSVVDCRFN